jgi:hypothetical protein
MTYDSLHLLHLCMVAEQNFKSFVYNHSILAENHHIQYFPLLFI